MLRVRASEVLLGAGLRLLLRKQALDALILLCAGLHLKTHTCPSSRSQGAALLAWTKI